MLDHIFEIMFGIDFHTQTQTHTRTHARARAHTHTPRWSAAVSAFSQSDAPSIIAGERTMRLSARSPARAADICRFCCYYEFKYILP